MAVDAGASLKARGRVGRSKTVFGAGFLAPGSLARRRLARVIHHHHLPPPPNWAAQEQAKGAPAVAVVSTTPTPRLEKAAQ